MIPVVNSLKVEHPIHSAVALVLLSPPGETAHLRDSIKDKATGSTVAYDAQRLRTAVQLSC